MKSWVMGVAALIAVGCSEGAGTDNSLSPASGGQAGLGATAGAPGPFTAGGSGGPVVAGSSAGGMSVGVAGSAAGVGVASGAGAAGTVDTTGIAGMAGMAGLAGMAGAEPQAGSGGSEPHSDLGEGDGHDVIAIGDSWMNLGSSGIQQSLLEASGQPYRVYGVPGTRLLDEAIPNQYTQAKAENPDIKTIVMTGGGNDILQDPAGLLDCPATGDVCKGIIDMIGARYLELADEAAADGVEDVIIINYSRGTLLGAGPIDYSYQTIAPMCEMAPVRCHLVDPDAAAGGTIELRDGIHPTDAGYDLLGQHIYDLMVSEGMRR